VSAAALRKPAVEELFCSAERIVLLSGVHYNLNLRELFEARFGPWRGEDVRFVLARGARILSRRADLPACDSGYWPNMNKGDAWLR
jgi:hypothetical protein